MHMLNVIRGATLSSSMLFIVVLLPINAFAQSIDDCMTADQTTAIEVCKSILDNGSRNANVYWKLSSTLFQNGQETKATTTLNDALRLHPANAKLLKLREIISSASTEQEMLESPAQLNQRSFDQDALKILCLAKSGAEGISACERRLELTDIDGDSIRDRLKELQSQQPSKSVAIATTSESSFDQLPLEKQIIPKPVNISENDPAQVETELSELTYAEQRAAEKRKNAYKKLVTQVQTSLNKLGFPTGTPDGFPGNKTRTALSNFYTELDEPANKSISDLTLEHLIFQQRKLANAQQLLVQSEEAFAQGNTILAQQKLIDAKASSKLLKVSDQFEREIQFSQVDVTVDLNSEVNTEESKDFGTPVTSDEQSTEQSTNNKLESAENFTDLMNQINTLQGQIKRVEEEQTRRTDQLRDIMK